MKTKTCTGCKLPLSINRFSFDKNRLDGRCYYCKDCYIINERRQRISYANRRLDLYLQRTYGITRDEFNSKLASQNGVCAICFKLDPENDRLCVDHNHITGKVRGLLCRPCNNMIGGARDNINILNKGIDYLNTFKE